MPTFVIFLLDLHFLWWQAQNHLALISQFSNQCPTAEKMTPNCAWHSLCYCVNCLVSCEYNENSVILDPILTSIKVQNRKLLLILLFLFFSMRPGFCHQL